MFAPFALSENVCFQRLHSEEPSTFRTPLQRDRDRITHSAAFRKLGYKTQVFMCYQDDYYRTRLSHSLEVAQVARTLARYFAVNEDLVETLALAHDIGHAPFGHAGEEALNAVMAPFGGFDHNAQTLRLVTHLERRYPTFLGLNLTWDVLEGLVKHNGPLLKPGETIDIMPYALRVYAREQDLHWQTFASFEAQLVALSDDMAYNTHDFEDGLRAGFFTLDDLIDLPILGPIVQSALTKPHPDPWVRIYDILRQFLGAMITDVITQTAQTLAQLAPQSPDDIRQAQKPTVTWSLGDAQAIWRQFLFQHMYHHPKVLAIMIKAKRAMTDLFTIFHAQPSLLFSPLVPHSEEAARLVCDTIASMTDRSVLEEHRKFFNLNSL